MINIDSISKLHQLLGYEKPKHPLISVIDFNNINNNKELINRSAKANLYIISLKDNPNCELRYGRKYYDFSEGSLVFSGPGQEFSSGENSTTHEGHKTDGWALCIHPDLIKNTSLSRKIPEYSFFEYEVNEALHLSDAEREIIENIIKNIQIEYSMNLDMYSTDLIISNLEVFFNYVKRFYGRQFITRMSACKDVVTKFEKLLKDRCMSDNIEKLGSPTVKELAKHMGYSPNYLSDLLKKETGKSAQEYIKLKVLELAEELLLTTREPIYIIADKLGFEQASSFSKFIKLQHGVSPVEFRKKYGIN